MFGQLRREVRGDYVHQVSELNRRFRIVVTKKTYGAKYTHYTPGIYAEGYIVFVFPFVRSYGRSFVRSYFRPVRGITSKFYVQATRVKYISPTTHQKAFIFGPRYPGGSAFIVCLLTPVSMPRVGARGQKLGHI